PRGGRQPVQLLRGEHPRHPRVVDVVRVRVGRRGRLAVLAQPAPHHGDLVLLRDVDAPGEEADVLAGGALGDEGGHHQRLTVVGEHVAHEARVRLGGGGRGGRGSLRGGDGTGGLARGAGAHGARARGGGRGSARGEGDRSEEGDGGRAPPGRVL